MKVIEDQTITLTRRELETALFALNARVNEYEVLFQQGKQSEECYRDGIVARAVQRKLVAAIKESQKAFYK